MSNNASQKIQHIFVLMLENRSFDHMLGFSGITGIDAQTHQPTKIEGLNGQESNTYKGVNYPVTQPADYTMPFDPGHEFSDTVTQLCGAGAKYPSGGPYPAINNSGFVDDYATTKSSGEGGATSNFGEIMKCYGPIQLPVMNALAKEFAVCDHWFSGIPGPTWPNRFFAMAASSGGLDHSPTTSEILLWETLDGYTFKNGSIFDSLNAADPAFGYRIYRGDEGSALGSVPIASALKGISIGDTEKYSNFVQDVNGSYPWKFTFIEPNYGDITNNSYVGGTSQHPMDDVRNGEKLIKSTYEAIRNSPLWDNSMLIVTYDEHGGFYDHVAPPKTVAPGDGSLTSKYNQNGFNFEQLGVRVPAIIVSPYIAKNTIDHRVYEHSSIPSTVKSVFGLPNFLTNRDAQAKDLTTLLTLSTPRTDTPSTLPDPSTDFQPTPLRMAIENPNDDMPTTGNLPNFLHIALKNDLSLSLPAEQEEIKKTFAGLRTKQDAQDYINKVFKKVDRYEMMNK